MREFSSRFLARTPSTSLVTTSFQMIMVTITTTRSTTQMTMKMMRTTICLQTRMSLSSTLMRMRKMPLMLLIIRASPRSTLMLKRPQSLLPRRIRRVKTSALLMPSRRLASTISWRRQPRPMQLKSQSSARSN